MGYQFRIRFTIPPGQHIETDELELVLREGDSRRVSIHPLGENTPISKAREFALRGVGYTTKDDARDDGEKWIGALSLGFISESLPAVFGARVLPGGFVPGELDAMSSTAGRAVYNDTPGLIVVPDRPTPVFIGLSGTASAVKNAEDTVTAVCEVYAAGLLPDERASLAIEMFSASWTSGDADFRFLSLMIALEALSDQGESPESRKQAVRRLREHLDAMDYLDATDAEQLRAALGNLKRESMRAAGRRLASALGERRYNDRTPVKFFDECYAARNELVHGNMKRPLISQIWSLTGPLQSFVRDLVRMRVGLDLLEQVEPDASS